MKNRCEYEYNNWIGSPPKVSLRVVVLQGTSKACNVYIQQSTRVEIYIRTDAFPKVIVRMLFCCVGNTTKLKKAHFYN